MRKAERLLERARRRQQLPSPSELRRLRTEAGLTQLDVAGCAGVSAACVSRYEAGVRRPRGKHLDRLLELVRTIRNGQPA
jgi:predicted transcriptional regulator